jgi:7,8-dihydroneopterin aldolase/epimerase/oxygenase
MLTISIDKARFYCYHGLYAEEQKVGGEFEVNLAVQYLPIPAIVTSIDDTINYVTLFEIVKRRMQVPTPLLETLVMQIADDVKESFTDLKRISVRISKMQPPIPQFTGSTSVLFEKEF